MFRSATILLILCVTIDKINAAETDEDGNPFDEELAGQLLTCDEPGPESPKQPEEPEKQV